MPRADVALPIQLIVRFVIVSLTIPVSTWNLSGAGNELRDIHHTAWNSDNGLGAVTYVQQDSDGYLWLTTSKGLFRFDGVKFQSIDEATRGLARNKDLDSLFVSKSGGLWLSTQRQGMLFYKDGKTTTFSDRRCTPLRGQGQAAEDVEGSFWMRSSAGLGRIKNGTCEMMGIGNDFPSGSPRAVATDRSGTVWVKVPSGNLLFLRRGESKFQVSPSGTGPVGDFTFIHEAPDGSMWLSDLNGLRAISDNHGDPLISAPTRKLGPAGSFVDFTFAPDGTLWAANHDGVVRFRAASVEANGVPVDANHGESFTLRPGADADVIWKIIVDREGSIWLATNSGLDQLRQAALSSVPLPPHQDFQFGVAAGADGSIWMGNRGFPLTSVAADGTVRSFPETGQAICIRRDFRGDIWSCGVDENRVWRRTGTNLAPLHFPNEKLEIPAAVATDKNEGLWVSTVAPRIYHRGRDGVWQQMNEVLGRKPGVFGAMAGDDSGNVWFAFSNNLVKWDGTAFERHSFPEGAMNVSVANLAFHEDRVWLGGMSGIVLFRGGVFQRLRWKNEDLLGRVYGLVETNAGDLWANTSSGIVHVPAFELRRWLADSNYPVSAERLDALDGLVGLAGDRLPDPSVVQATDGRLWFGTTKAVMWLNPDILEQNRNMLQPKVLITSVSGDKKSYRPTNSLRLPPRTDNLQFDYTALSLAIPERVQFRYRLEGKDTQWQEVGTRRQAFYNNLPPGNYRFRVSACNNDGVWSETGASLDFVLAPAFYQTWLFELLCTVGVVFLIGWAVRIRIGRITRQLEVRHMERLDERERIARELHDTLLQSLFGLMLQFESVASTLPSGDTARAQLGRALDQAGRVMEEGRDRVKSLRASRDEQDDLIELLIGVGQQLESLGKTKFTFVSQGQRRPLKQVIQEEVLLVARESLMNAFAHAQAKTVTLQTAYMPNRFCVTVVDDGCGISEDVLKAGSRVNHWGLPGMKERAAKIGATLKIECPREGGTCLELSIPAIAAYRGGSSGIRHLLTSPVARFLLPGKSLTDHH